MSLLLGLEPLPFLFLDPETAGRETSVFFDVSAQHIILAVRDAEIRAVALRQSASAGSFSALSSAARLQPTTAATTTTNSESIVPIDTSLTKLLLMLGQESASASALEPVPEQASESNSVSAAPLDSESADKDENKDASNHPNESLQPSDVHGEENQGAGMLRTASSVSAAIKDAVGECSEPPSHASELKQAENQQELQNARSQLEQVKTHPNPSNTEENGDRLSVSSSMSKHHSAMFPSFFDEMQSGHVISANVGNKGVIQSVKLSLDKQFLAILRSTNTVEFFRLADSAVIYQTCKSLKQPINILGVFWTYPKEMAIVTTSGVEFFQYNEQKGSFKMFKSYSIAINWFAYSPDCHLLMIATGAQCNQMQGYLISPGSVSRLPKLDMYVPEGSKILRRDIALVKLYEDIYCIQFHINKPAASMYCIRPNEIVQMDDVQFPFQQSSNGGDYGVNTVDDLLLIHCLDSQKCVIIDIKSKEGSPFSRSSPVVGMIDRGATTVTTNETTSSAADSSSAQNLHEGNYDDDWVFFHPNIIISPERGKLWFLRLLYTNIGTAFNDPLKHMEFLLRRSGPSSRESALQLIAVLLREGRSKRAPLRSIWDLVARTNASYSKSLAKSANTGDKKAAGTTSYSISFTSSIDSSSPLMRNSPRNANGTHTPRSTSSSISARNSIMESDAQASFITTASHLMLPSMSTSLKPMAPTEHKSFYTVDSIDPTTLYSSSSSTPKSAAVNNNLAAGPRPESPLPSSVLGSKLIVGTNPPREYLNVSPMTGTQSTIKNSSSTSSLASLVSWTSANQTTLDALGGDTAHISPPLLRKSTSSTTIPLLSEKLDHLWGTMLIQRDIVCNVITPLCARKLLDESYAMTALFDYTSALERHGEPFGLELEELLLRLLFLTSQFDEIERLVKQNILSDSLFTALLLMSAQDISSSTFLVGLDMLRRLTSEGDREQVFHHLLQRNEIAGAIRFWRQSQQLHLQQQHQQQQQQQKQNSHVRLANTVFPAAKLIAAADMSGDAQLLYDVYEFFWSRNAWAKGNAEGDGSESYEEVINSRFPGGIGSAAPR